MNYIEKPHVTTCNNSHTTNDVKKMKNHFSRRRSADRGKRDEKEMTNQQKRTEFFHTQSRYNNDENYDKN